MKNRNGGDDEYSRREKRVKLIKAICFIAAIVFAFVAVGCVIAYAATKKDILFIPMAIAAVFAMILFTYWSNVKA